MICERCHREITFNEWADGFCVTLIRHFASGWSIRDAYHKMLEEMAYARNQP